jgi:hypothetical protein
MVFGLPASASTTVDTTGTAAPAGVSAGCTWDACTGKDAAAMGCLADAVVLHNQDVDFTEKLYYSEACRAAWAETNDLICEDGGHCYLSLWYTQPFGFPEQHLSVPYTNSGLLYRTPMSSWNNSVKACQAYGTAEGPVDVDPQGYGGYAGSGSRGACTRWF